MPSRLPSLARLISGVLLCLTPSLTNAEPITTIITSGFATYDTTQAGGMDLLALTGTQGFTLIADPVIGNTSPRNPLAPGEMTRFQAVWAGDDLPGIATFRGETFANLGAGGNAPNNALVKFLSTSFTLPQPGPSGTAMILAPFTLEGLFTGQSSSSQVAVRLIGSGIGRLPLTFNPTLGLYDTGTVRLDISTPPEVIPEPATLILLGAGLAGAYRARRCRKRTASD